MLKQIAIGTLAVVLSSFGSITLAQPTSTPSTAPAAPNRPDRPIPSLPAPVPGSAVENSPILLNRPSSTTPQPLKNRNQSNQLRPYPVGTPCGVTTIKGVKTLVSPEGVPGAYCDKKHTIQYQ